MTSEKLKFYATSFFIPLLVVVGLLLYILFYFLGLQFVAIPVALITILIGSYKLVLETIEDIKNSQFGLDYIAILAVVLSIATSEYLVGIILALMIASGRNLEEFAVSSAKKSLTALSERIPHDVTVEQDHTTSTKPVTSVKIGEIILVRKGEVIPLDGTLVSDSGIVDESSLTGEAFPVDKYKGDCLRSGILNVGQLIKIEVTKEEKDSTYKKIVLLVAAAQKEKAPACTSCK